MKRTLLCVVSLLLSVCMLVACGSAKSVDLKTVFDDINSKFGFTDLIVLEEASKLNRYFQIDESKVKQFAAELSTESSVFTEIILIEAVDEAAAKEMVTALNNHLQTRKDEAKSYNPESVAMLDKCTVENNGTYVTLIIDEKASEIRDLYNSYFK